MNERKERKAKEIYFLLCRTIYHFTVCDFVSRWPDDFSDDVAALNISFSLFVLANLVSHLIKIYFPFGAFH